MPDTRFIDNADGTVTDNLTGLVWLQNASCFGPRIWWDALLDANNLAGGVRVNTSYAQSHLHPGRAWARLEVRC